MEEVQEGLTLTHSVIPGRVSHGPAFFVARGTVSIVVILPNPAVITRLLKIADMIRIAELGRIDPRGGWPDPHYPAHSKVI
jgi:hypothetical protein